MKKLNEAKLTFLQSRTLTIILSYISSEMTISEAIQELEDKAKAIEAVKEELKKQQ